ncbi:MAG: preprotein translocase subunit SecE [Christensenellaceae bacterium]|nr:preprotein translocase subunit SecE [Christensenellaceae bacterium]
MAKTVLLGKDKEKQLKEQKRIAKQKNKKQRKPLGRRIKDIISELKKVTWPSRKDLISYSVAVLVFIVILAVVTGLIDMGLGALLKLVTSGS